MYVAKHDTGWTTIPTRQGICTTLGIRNHSGMLFWSNNHWLLLIFFAGLYMRIVWDQQWPISVSCWHHLFLHAQLCYGQVECYISVVVVTWRVRIKSNVREICAWRTYKRQTYNLAIGGGYRKAFSNIYLNVFVYHKVDWRIDPCSFCPYHIIGPSLKK